MVLVVGEYKPHVCIAAGLADAGTFALYGNANHEVEVDLVYII